MTQATHTPGPWTVRTGAFGLYISATMDADTDQRIRLADMPRDEDDAETRANAALIASAPDLLAALREARNVLAGIATGDLRTIRADSPVLAQVRSTIARAEGREVRP